MSGQGCMAEAALDRWSVVIEEEGGEFVCGSDQNLLLAMINARRTSVKVGCRSGGCGVCRVKITRGRFAAQKMSRSRISEADEAAGIVLACRVVPQSDIGLMPLPLNAGEPRHDRCNSPQPAFRRRDA